jgi:hypothetical protein
MAPKKSPVDLQELSSDEEESIEVQVEGAKKRAKGNPALKERGKAVQAQGAAARKTQGAASSRERDLDRLTKRNNQLERLAKISELEAAERSRGELLSKSMPVSTPKNNTEANTRDGELNARLAKMEELLTARNAEAAPAKKGKKKASKPPPPSSSDDEDEQPRQKAVRKSAKTELKRRAGAEEEHLHGKGAVLGNRNKAKAMDMDAQKRFRDLANSIMPGRF